MGRLQRIENIINSTISTYAHLKVFPRGLPRFIDPLLRGVVRFAKRTGNNVAVLNPENLYELETAPQVLDQQIVLTTASPWLELNCLLSIGPDREMVQIDDIFGATVQLRSQLRRSYTTMDKVSLHAFPMIVATTTPAGSTVVTVRSHHKLGNGDEFSYLQTPGILESIISKPVTKAILTGTTADPFYTLLYDLELGEPTTIDLTTNEMVFLRAHPAYFSNSIRVPNSLDSSEPIGPFLLDFVSGRLIEGSPPEETLSLRALNRSGAYAIGSSSEYLTIHKNWVIGDRPCPAHTPLFWDLAEGVMRFTTSRIVFRVNELSQFTAGYICVPPFPAEKSWRVSLLPSNDCTIRFVFYPNAPQEFILTAGVPQTVTIVIPSGPDVDRFEINILAASNVCDVSMSDWTPTGDTIDSLDYSLVVKARGEGTYQATGLTLKPYFLSTDLLRATYDSGFTSDGGKVYF